MWLTLQDASRVWGIPLKKIKEILETGTLAAAEKARELYNIDIEVADTIRRASNDVTKSENETPVRRKDASSISHA
jgi:hypothetical protein